MEKLHYLKQHGCKKSQEKAFDKTDDLIPVYKLHHYGSEDQLTDWFLTYLSSRTQSIQIGYICSIVFGKDNLVCGVTQGSILGPLLFLASISSSQTPQTCYAQRKTSESSENSKLTGQIAKKNPLPRANLTCLSSLLFNISWTTKSSKTTLTIILSNR